MDQVFQYRIPVLHPTVVHFPITLVIVAFAFIVMWILRDRVFWMTTALFIELIGFVGVLVAYLTGEAMEEQSEGVPIVEKLVHTHEDAALVTLILVGAAVLGLLGARIYSARDTSHPGTRMWMRLVVGFIAAAAAVAVLWTAHIGGTMVWGIAA